MKFKHKSRNYFPDTFNGTDKLKTPYLHGHEMETGFKGVRLEIDTHFNFR